MFGYENSKSKCLIVTEIAENQNYVTCFIT